MLELKSITKTYVIGSYKKPALKGIDLAFRDNEFVAILGQSGSGKTTLLNIIGGLDRYTDGDLKINGLSTKQYRDRDWDTYRNHSIGFVFQSYNLIMHQSVLSNVEMALTLSGVSKKERRQRALDVLAKVGLTEHLNKKPTQISGGQMQRVAIARALINNPDILLADEPTGALDSETSIQIMDLLKEIAKDKLVIMVTHNPELAEEYANRIVRLKDGLITGDTNPFVEIPEIKEARRPTRKSSMNFLTALSLSFNNLLTKIGRTIMTGFAGSIGIIGIALILALSTGMQTYINAVQKDTLTAYPITIDSSTMDLSSLISNAGLNHIREDILEGQTHDDDKVYTDYSAIKTSETIINSLIKNNLSEFKKYLDDPDSDIRKYLGENGILYSYDISFYAYSFDADGNLIRTDADPENKKNNGGGIRNMFSQMTSFSYGSNNGEAQNFSELGLNADGTGISPVITNDYDLLYGSWPDAKDEVVLFLNFRGSLSASMMFKLGYITQAQYKDAVDKIASGEEPQEIAFSYDELAGHTFYVLPNCDLYQSETKNGKTVFALNEAIDADYVKAHGIPLKVSGIAVMKKEAKSPSISSGIGYSALLTNHIIDYSEKSPVIQAQLNNPELNILNGLPFKAADDEQKKKEAAEYLSNLSISEKASLMQFIMAQSPTGGLGGFITSEVALAGALDAWLMMNRNSDLLLTFYDQYIAGATYDDNMNSFGYISKDSPSSISIYVDSFEAKDSIAECIQKYNEAHTEEEKITYTDYVALLTSSITTIINGITYVLIAFVAISLVVSCIMIGIITNISVLERTKEIGILRALGASKHNISQVFNAETFIIGCLSGLIGCGISYALLVPINAIIQNLSGLTDLKAILPLTSALVLVIISIVITLIGGLIPAKKASGQDPVIALRTE